MELDLVGLAALITAIGSAIAAVLQAFGKRNMADTLRGVVRGVEEATSQLTPEQAAKVKHTIGWAAKSVGREKELDVMLDTLGLRRGKKDSTP